MLVEASRKRKRDKLKGKANRFATAKEFKWIDDAHRLEKENPFVLMTVMDGIVDLLRDVRGTLKVGDNVFESIGNGAKAMLFMKLSA